MTAFVLVPLLLGLLVVLLGVLLVAVLRATRSELRDVRAEIHTLSDSISQLARSHERSLVAISSLAAQALTGLNHSTPCEDA